MTEKRAEVLNEIVAFIHASGGVGVTRRQVREHLGLKMTPYLIDLLNKVVEGGWARVEWDMSLKHPSLVYYPASPVVLEKLTPEDYMH